MDEVNLHSVRALCALYPVVVSMVVILASCASQGGTPTYIHVCPSIPTYSKAFEQQAGVQLEALPADSPITKMVEDYLAVRAEAKACK